MSLKPIIVCFFIVTLFASSSLTFANAQSDYVIETVADNLEIPWSIAFSPDNRIFFTERTGKLRVIEDGNLRQEPVKTLNVGAFEGGLLGIALDPKFAENHYLYLYYTYNDFLTTYNKIVRYTEKNNELIDEFVLLEKIPGAAIHDGGRLKFGPDGKLYITTGDAANTELAQDLTSLAGKILRINSDGTIPKDNPFENSSVYSYGHRNPQGLDWDPLTGKLIVTEHGQSAHDEINIVESGKNYGWPEIVGDGNNPDYVNPLLHTGSETWAPSGATFYNSEDIPEWTNKFFVATLRGNHLRMLEIDSLEKSIVSSQVLFEGEFGRLRDAAVGNDGYLYILTSNQDGRGSPAPNDDRIIRVMASQKIDYSFMTPLKQTQEGILSSEVQCKKNMVLLLKSSSEKPTCVFESSVSKLLDFGWAIKAK